MAEQVINFSNFLSGNNITNIANAYPDASYVWVILQETNLDISKISITGKPANYNVTVSDDESEKSEPKHVKVSFTYTQKVQRTALYEYMTVVAIRRDGKNVTICENYKIGANRSYIITKEGDIKPQKYGHFNLFLDESGTNHELMTY